MKEYYVIIITDKIYELFRNIEDKYKRDEYKEELAKILGYKYYSGYYSSTHRKSRSKSGQKSYPQGVNKNTISNYYTGIKRLIENFCSLSDFAKSLFETLKLQGVFPEEYDGREQQIIKELNDGREVNFKLFIFDLLRKDLGLDSTTLSQTQKDKPDVSLPNCLTKTSYISKQSVLFRDDFIDSIEKNLLPNFAETHPSKVNVLVTGYGGWGKTSIAKILFWNMLKYVETKQYDAIGWIDYHISLKNSFVSTNSVLLHQDEPNPDVRWELIKKTLLNSKSTGKILLFIDNVDQNADIKQFPQNDMDLQDFADSPSINLVVTSRLRNPINGRTLMPFEVPHFSEEERVKLFCYYLGLNNPSTENVEYIKELLSKAGENTLAIKLLALGAKFKGLADYTKEIKKVGFNFYVSIENKETIAVNELKKLFDLQSRTPEQNKILWDFAVLPQITLSLDDVTVLMNYKRHDLEPLVEEGWLSYDGGFSLHPLIKSVILSQGPVPKDTMQYLLCCIEKNKLSCSDNYGSEKSRIVSIVEHLFQYGDRSSLSADFFYNFGIMEYLYEGNRLTSIAYLEKAKKMYNSSISTEPERIAETLYQIGYIKSTTHDYRKEAHHDLRLSLEGWQLIGEHPYEIDMVKDHLGYVLSDSPSSYEEAKDLLLDAYASRKERMETSKTKHNIADYATTCDNLGCLLMKTNPKSNKTTDLLNEAMKIREDLLTQYGDNENDVAWTACNYGKHLAFNLKKYDKAIDYLQRSTALYQKLKLARPGKCLTDYIFSLSVFAKVLCEKDNSDTSEIINILEKIHALKNELNVDRIGFYLEEIEENIAYTKSKINIKNTD